MDFTHLFDLNTIVGKIATGVVLGLGKVAYNKSKAYLKRVYSRRQSILKNLRWSGLRLDNTTINSRKKTVQNHQNGALRWLFGAKVSQKKSNSFYEIPVCPELFKKSSTCNIIQLLLHFKKILITNINPSLLQQSKKILHGLENVSFPQTGLKKAITCA